MNRTITELRNIFLTNQQAKKILNSIKEISSKIENNSVKNDLDLCIDDLLYCLKDINERAYHLTKGLKKDIESDLIEIGNLKGIMEYKEMN